MDLSKMTNYALVLMSTRDPDGDMRKHTINELARRLEIAEAKAATYWAECEAWRNQAGVWLIVDGEKHWYIQDGNTLFEITEAAATDAARGGAE